MWSAMSAYPLCVLHVGRFLDSFDARQRDYLFWGSYVYISFVFPHYGCQVIPTLVAILTFFILVSVQYS
jgi:hypothetical protein